MQHITHKLNCVNRLIGRKLNNMPLFKQASDLTGRHGYILGFLLEHQQEKIYQKDLEKAFDVRRSTMSEILNIMEDNGLIMRITDSNDARLKEIVLTEKGSSMHKIVIEEILKVEEETCNILDKEEIEELNRMLDKIINYYSIGGKKDD